jgi:hypothetical protein
MYLSTAVAAAPPAGLSGFRVPLPRYARTGRGLVLVRGGRGMAGVVQHNFFGTMVPYNTVDVEMAAVANSWKVARGNGTGYADRSVQRDPADCIRPLLDVARDHCGLAPEACQGFDVNAIAAALCADYTAWFNATFPKGWGDAYNYDDATYLAKFGAAALAERRAGSVGVVNPGQTGNSYPGGDPFFDQRGGTIAPTVKAPVVQLPAPAQPPIINVAAAAPAAPKPAPVVTTQSATPAAVTTIPAMSVNPASVAPVVNGGAGSMGFDSSMDVFGFSVPVWALGVGAAAGVWLLSRR